MEEKVLNYNRANRPPEVEHVEPVFETTVQQGYIPTKIMIKRFREAGLKVEEFKKNYDYSGEDDG